MDDLKRLKANRDLARMHHGSLQSEQSQAALDAAEHAYQAALNSDTDSASTSGKPAKGPAPKAGTAPSKAPAKNFTPPAAPAPEKPAEPDQTETDQTEEPAGQEDDSAEKKSEPPALQ